MVLGMESWFFNFSQFISKGSNPRSLADVPRPYLEYSLWGTFKGAELASVIGTISFTSSYYIRISQCWKLISGGCIAHPIYRIYLTKTLKPEKTTPNSHKIIRSACRKLQVNCIFFQ